MNVTTSSLKAGQSLPLVITPGADCTEHTTADFLQWANGNRVWIADHLADHGGLVFRGFNLKDAGQFEAFNDALGFELMEYIRGNTPRSVVKNKVYTSTEIQRFVPIPLHNEMSYHSKFPSLIAFFCHTRSPVGGETPIADMHEVYNQVPPRIRDQFAERGLKYTQIVAHKPSRFMKKTWTEMFNTDDPAEVQRICADQHVHIEWGKRQVLRLNHVRPAFLTHPTNGKSIWFNQAHIFHPSFSRELKRFNLPLRALLLKRFEIFARRWKPDLYPYNCTYGDGGKIPLEDIETIRDVLWSQAVTSPWQQGDLVLLDNLWVAHARLPYDGPRLVLTSLIQGMKVANEKQAVRFPSIEMNVDASYSQQNDPPVM